MEQRPQSDRRSTDNNARHAAILASLELIDDLDHRIGEIEKRLHRCGAESRR